MTDRSDSNTAVPAPRRTLRWRVRTAALAACTAVAAAASLAAPGSALAAGPHVITAGATHVLATSALLTGSVNPEGVETSYYFRYGATVAYGLQTAPASAGSGTEKVQVGTPVGGLVPGGTYHFRIVAVSTNGGVAEGKDRVFKARGTPLVFEVPKAATAVYGTPVILTGQLKGQSAAFHRIGLQASPFPYLEPFTTIGVPGTTNALGRFSFRVANLLASTQLRMTTLDPLPIYSHLILVNVAVRVTLHARSSHGLVRLYGSVSPAVPRAKVFLQLHKAIRPDKSERTARWASLFKTSTKRNGGGSSRFSIVVRVKHAGRYRALVRMPAGALVSGVSSTVVLHS